ncbi:MAG: glycosyltransferase family 4 protein [Candidatus Aminicenantales bacterium]
MSLFQVDAGREWRGGQRQAFFLARALKRKGYPFTFVLQPDSPLHQKALAEGLPVFPLRIRGEIDPLSVWRLLLLMKRRRCRLVHFHDAHSAAVGSMAASLAKVPIRLISRRVDFPLKKHFFSRQKYTRRIDAIIAISEGVKNVLVDSGIDPNLITVIPSGIDFSAFERPEDKGDLRHELGLDPDAFLVGIVAHLAHHKGHQYLIRATHYLKEHSPKIKVLIIGEGPLRMELDKLARSIHVEDMVFFLGFRDDVPRILRSLDVFVLSSYLEGMGSSILDAMACRLPVVATRVGGIPEVVVHRKTGILVPPRSPKALAQAIIRLYEDRDLAARLGEEGYNIVHEKFSADAMAARVIELYEDLASRKGVRLDERGAQRSIQPANKSDKGKASGPKNTHESLEGRRWH